MQLESVSFEFLNGKSLISLHPETATELFNNFNKALSKGFHFTSPVEVKGEEVSFNPLHVVSYRYELKEFN